MKIRLVYFVIAIALLCLYFYITSLYDKKTKADYNFFYASKLNGKIVYIYASKGGEVFQLDNSNDIYRFRSIMSNMNDDKNFAYIAKKDDSVFKSPFSDTLFLMKRNNLKIYRYTFQKF